MSSIQADSAPFTVRPSRAWEDSDANLTKVYILEGAASVKVGISTNPTVRAAALNKGKKKRDCAKIHSTFICVGCEAQAVEREAHKILRPHLLDGRGREWFGCSAEVATEAISKAAGRLDPEYNLAALRRVTDKICEYQTYGALT